MPDYAIVGEWLAESVGDCTCGGGPGAYGHERGCGLEPIQRVEDLLRDAALGQRMRALFAPGPDTSCRTVWEHGDASGAAIECVSVPLDDLRRAMEGPS